MENKNLPLFGVGPIYVAIIIIMTMLGIILIHTGYLRNGEFVFLRLPFFVVGVILIVYGLILWIAAVVFTKIDANIQKNCLVTYGIYAYVRNPIYSAFMIACTGALLCFNNLWLLILPIIYWGFMTILMKNTEEKWLKNLYGQDYIDYCNCVNRCIPWVKMKK